MHGSFRYVAYKWVLAVPRPAVTWTWLGQGAGDPLRVRREQRLYGIAHTGRHAPVLYVYPRRPRHARLAGALPPWCRPLVRAVRCTFQLLVVRARG
jgi:hypothetical protein